MHRVEESPGALVLGFPPGAQCHCGTAFLGSVPVVPQPRGYSRVQSEVAHSESVGENHVSPRPLERATELCAFVAFASAIQDDF